MEGMAPRRLRRTQDEDPSLSSCRDRLIGIEDRIFTEWRLRFYGMGVIVAYAISLAWRAFKHEWVILPGGDARAIDFGWMWLSGKLAASGEVAQVFNQTAFSSAQLAFFSLSELG